LSTRFDRTVVERVILKRTLAGLVADRAIERVIDEQKLHLPAARLLDFLVPDVDLHPVFHRGRAAGLQLRHALDFDETHATLTDDGQRGVIAEMRDVNVRKFGGLNDVDAVLNFDFDSVDGNFTHRVDRGDAD